MRRYSSIRNGKKGGRKNYGSAMQADELSKYSLIVLTESQYSKLLERYGKQLLESAMDILQNWLKSNPKKASDGKNKYAYFRVDGWVINSAKKLM